MGSDKALLAVDGAPMAIRVADALRAAGAADVFAVGGDELRLGEQGLRVVPDDRPGEGPFPATLTALRHAAHPIVAVLSCDLVQPRAEAITHLVDALLASDVAVPGAVPVVGGHHQWTHAVWRVGALEPLQAAHVAGARSLRRGAAGLALCEVFDLDPQHVADADSPDDLPGPLRRSARRRG